MLQLERTKVQCLYSDLNTLGDISAIPHSSSINYPSHTLQHNPPLSQLSSTQFKLKISALTLLTKTQDFFSEKKRV